MRSTLLFLLATLVLVAFIYASRRGALSQTIRVVRSDDAYLELRAQWRTITADKIERKVFVGKFKTVPFQSIEAVEIETFDIRDAPFWTVRLCLLRDKRVFLGRTGDDVEASIVASRLAKLLDVQVVAI